MKTRGAETNQQLEMHSAQQVCQLHAMRHHSRESGQTMDVVLIPSRFDCGINHCCLSMIDVRSAFITSSCCLNYGKTSTLELTDGMGVWERPACQNPEHKGHEAVDLGTLFGANEDRSFYPCWLRGANSISPYPPKDRRIGG